MDNDTLNRIRTAINAEIAELRENSDRHSHEVQTNAIMIVEGLRRALRIIEDVSLKDGGNASAQPGWIPVTERLPDESGEYLVTVEWWVREKPMTGTLGYNADHGEWIDEKSIGWTVTAWQPKPQPWEGDRCNNDN